VTFSFESEPKIGQAAEAYSLKMIDFAKTTFGIDLNWSDESIRQIETIAAALHEDYKKKHPTPEQVAHMYRMVGSYIGEVYRKNHGAEWGWVISPGGDRFPGLESASTRCWPWARAQKRIVDGPEDNIWHYYQYLLNPNTSTLAK